jgi:hypothetical protein
MRSKENEENSGDGCAECTTIYGRLVMERVNEVNPLADFEEVVVFFQSGEEK